MTKLTEPNGVACAEGDLLGEALAALEVIGAAWNCAATNNSDQDEEAFSRDFCQHMTAAGLPALRAVLAKTSGAGDKQ